MSATATTDAASPRTVGLPRTTVVRGGCPNCGSARLRTAPAAMLSPTMHWLTGKKRYGCSDCKWRGWREPMLRRGKAKPRPMLQREVSPKTSALVICASILSILLVSLQAGCNPRQDTTNTGGPVGVVKNPLW